MDLEHLCYEFLDLTNIDERDRHFLIQSLCESDTSKDFLQLPWPLQTNDYHKKKNTKKKFYNQNLTQNGASQPQFDLNSPIQNVTSGNNFGALAPTNLASKDISTLELHYLLMNGVENHCEPQIIVPESIPVQQIPIQPAVAQQTSVQPIIVQQPAAQPVQQVSVQSPIVPQTLAQPQTPQQTAILHLNNAEIPEPAPPKVPQQYFFNQEQQASPKTEQSPPQNKSWASLFGKPKSASSANDFCAENNEKSAEISTPDGINNIAALKSHQYDARFLEDPFSYRLGEFLHSYELDYRTYSLLPRGLTNRNNYCYINSILQALLSCSPFYNLLSAIPSRSSNSGKSLTPIIDSMITLIKECQLLSQNARVTRKEKGHRREDSSDLNCGVAFEPTWIYKMIGGSLADTFKVDGSQEDAEEFLGCLLNSLNDEMIKVKKLAAGYVTETVESAAKPATEVDKDDSWKVMGPKNKGSITRRTESVSTPLSDIFRGQLRSRVNRAGMESTDNVQPFLTLQINIEKANTVVEALENVMSKTQLDGVICSKTKQEVEAWQQVTLEELPVVLVLHLKCFDYKLDGCSKIIKALDFPIDLKIDSKLLSSSKSKYTGKQKQYKLFAIVYHDGKEATKGHYLTDIYHVGYSRWVRFDDASVKGVTEAQVLKPQGSRVPYLLFYRRCDTISSQVHHTGSGAAAPAANSTAAPGSGSYCNAATVGATSAQTAHYNGGPAPFGVKDDRRKSSNRVTMK